MGFILLIIFIIFLGRKLFLPKNQEHYQIDNDSFDNDIRSNLFDKKDKLTAKSYINKNGYRCFINSGILVHRWLMEKHIGRKLSKEEVVHHKDGNKLNNSIYNLQLFANQAEHYNHHLNLLYNYGSWYGYKKSAAYIKQL